MIERINKVREARQAAVDDDDGEDAFEFDEDVANIASQSISQNGGSNCSREVFTDIHRLRLQIELVRAEERKVQSGKEGSRCNER